MLVFHQTVKHLLYRTNHGCIHRFLSKQTKAARFAQNLLEMHFAMPSVQSAAQNITRKNFSPRTINKGGTALTIQERNHCPTPS